MSGDLGTWDGDTFTAADGREFTIFDEHIRGEPRYYYPLRRRDPAHPPQGRERSLGGHGAGDRDWLGLPVNGGTKRQARRDVERYVRETSG